MNVQAVRDALNRLEANYLRPDKPFLFREELEKELRKMWLAGYKAGRTDERNAIDGRE